MCVVCGLARGAHLNNTFMKMMMMSDRFTRCPIHPTPDGTYAHKYKSHYALTRVRREQTNEQMC